MPKRSFVCSNEPFFLSDETNDMDDSHAVIGNIDGGELAFGRKIILSRSGSHWVEYFREQKQFSRSFFREQCRPLFVCLRVIPPHYG